MANINIETLKTLNAKHMWSQPDLAAASGLSLRTIQRIFSEGKASVDSVKALSAAFNVDSAELLIDDRHVGVNAGVWFGIGGALLGYGCALFAIYLSVSQGTLSMAQAGQQAGMLGAIVGLTCAVIGSYGRVYAERKKV